MTIKDKVVIVTGASSGIGEATVRKLAQEGARLVIGARSEDKLEDLAQQLIPAEIVTRVTDVRVRKDVEALAALALSQFGRIDVIFNNAGIMPVSRLDEFKTNEWNDMVDTNIKGVLNGIASVLPTMEKQRSGQIITTDSVAGHIVHEGTAVYAGTKFAVQAIMDGLRQEEAAFNIQTTMISPGVVNTNLYQTISDDKTRQATQKSEAKGIPAEDVADAVAYAIDSPAGTSINEILMRPTWQVM
ncbi:SDR family oxidoreductase [Levilactobacillus bambusae]|uniref:Oxidoreductase n=1 Tax=Levilactobacillus bambusae TaxID=2024736 RepID=A0A2V1MZA7_9LACO|nr:SDR family oxidoreductase [Levilactobacillus bambusae]PWG00093.1 oxidoreductase [Levilactobacillus bambusae]